MKNFAVRILLGCFLAALGVAHEARAQYATQPPTNKLNITATTVVKPAQGMLVAFTVTTAGAVGAIYDTSTTGAVAASNLIAVIPATVGVYYVQFPFLTGLVVAPGAAQVVSVSYQ